MNHAELQPRLRAPTRSTETSRHGKVRLPRVSLPLVLVRFQAHSIRSLGADPRRAEVCARGEWVERHFSWVGTGFVLCGSVFFMGGTEILLSETARGLGGTPDGLYETEIALSGTPREAAGTPRRWSGTEFPLSGTPREPPRTARGPPRTVRGAAGTLDFVPRTTHGLTKTEFLRSRTQRGPPGTPREGSRAPRDVSRISVFWGKMSGGWLKQEARKQGTTQEGIRKAGRQEEALEADQTPAQHDRLPCASPLPARAAIHATLRTPSQCARTMSGRPARHFSGNAVQSRRLACPFAQRLDQIVPLAYQNGAQESTHRPR